MRLKLLFVAVTTGLSLVVAAQGQTNSNAITRQTVIEAEKIPALQFSNEKIDMMLHGLNSEVEDYQTIRSLPLPNSVPSAMLFNPIPVGMKWETVRKKFRMSSPGRVTMPKIPTTSRSIPSASLPRSSSRASSLRKSSRPSASIA